MTKKIGAPFGNKRRQIHGLCRTPVYKSWETMKCRCDNPRSDSYKWYGARGITYCESWSTFANFYADMGPRPEGMTLDRIDSDGNYEPGNCRWADKYTQARNRKFKRSTIWNANGNDLPPTAGAITRQRRNT